jgi:hypothetical protein
VAQLNELAGGERHKSEYLTRIIPILHHATMTARTTLRQQQVQAVADAVAKALVEEETKAQ